MEGTGVVRAPAGGRGATSVWRRAWGFLGQDAGLVTLVRVAPYTFRAVGARGRLVASAERVLFQRARGQCERVRARSEEGNDRGCLGQVRGGAEGARAERNARESRSHTTSAFGVFSDSSEPPGVGSSCSEAGDVNKMGLRRGKQQQPLYEPSSYRGTVPTMHRPS